MQDGRELLTVAEAIAMMGISRTTWQKLVTRGDTPPIVRIGSTQRIRRESLDAWLRSNETS